MDTNENTQEFHAEDVADDAAFQKEIDEGALALKSLAKHAEGDWTRWSAAIRGLRNLRILALQESGATEVTSGHYRKAFSRLTSQNKWKIYDDPAVITKHQRSACYKLMSHIDDIDAWYAKLDLADKLRWKSPDAVVKNTEQRYVEGRESKDNRPPKSVRKKPKGLSPDAKRFLDIALELLDIVMEHDAERGKPYIAKLRTPADFADHVYDILTEPLESEGDGEGNDIPI